MISKSQSISVRLSEEDYAYLMQIRQNGALTQSDKVRELIAMARESMGAESFARSFMASAESIAPYRARYKAPDAERSSVVDAVFDLLTESAAVIQSQDKNTSTSRLERQLFPAVNDFLRHLTPLLLTQRGGDLLNVDLAEQAKRKLLDDFSSLNISNLKE